MINTQLHNQLIELEIQRKAQESKKRVQEAKTQVLKERLKQALFIVGFVFIILLLLILLLWLLPDKSIKCPTYNGAKNQEKQSQTLIKQQSNMYKQKEEKPFTGTEYIKENNYIYKRAYKDGIMVQEVKLAPTITESKEQKHEKIPQFSMPNKK